MVPRSGGGRGSEQMRKIARKAAVIISPSADTRTEKAASCVCGWHSQPVKSNGISAMSIFMVSGVEVLYPPPVF